MIQLYLGSSLIRNTSLKDVQIFLFYPVLLFCILPCHSTTILPLSCYFVIGLYHRCNPNHVPGLKSMHVEVESRIFRSMLCNLTNILTFLSLLFSSNILLYVASLSLLLSHLDLKDHMTQYLKDEISSSKV